MEIHRDDKFFLTNHYKNPENPKKLKEIIFEIRKHNRNGLYEKKMMKKNEKLNYGKWNDEENAKFISTSLEYGADWFKVYIY